MNKEEFKALLMEMFKSGEIKVELEEEVCAYFSVGRAIVLIDDEVVYESDTVHFPTVL